MSQTQNRPSQKQIAFIISLCGGHYDSDAYREIAKDMGRTMTAAQSRSTKEDASRTIDRLKNEQSASGRQSYRPVKSSTERERIEG